ncbi:hypothetical protein AS132_23855 [Photobacterium sanguinicancri]|nr:hypothetical protein AS132_23855 [Photobacterium sanguinicancri]
MTVIYISVSSTMMVKYVSIKRLKPHEHLMRILEPISGILLSALNVCIAGIGSDWCEDNAVDIILGHALYMKVIHGGKAKTD